MSHLEVPVVNAFAAFDLPGFKQPMKEPQAFFIQGWLSASHFQERLQSADRPGQGCPRGAYHSMVLHVAGLAHRLVIDHHVYLSSQDVVTVKAAEVFQVPVLIFCLGIFIAEYQLARGGK